MADKKRASRQLTSKELTETHTYVRTRTRTDTLSHPSASYTIDYRLDYCNNFKSVSYYLMIT